MGPEEDLALCQGGKMLGLKQQYDTLYKYIQEQQREKEQQTQQILYQGDGHLKSLQKIDQLETLLEQLKINLTSEGKGVSGLPFAHLGRLAVDLQQVLKQESGRARKELQKSLQQTALSLLQGLEIGGEINKFAQLQQIASRCETGLRQLSDEYSYPSTRGRDSDVGNTSEQQDY